VDLSSSTAGWIAIGAVVAVIVLAVLVLLVWLDGRRSRRSERSVLSETSGRRDLVDFAITLQGRVDDLHRRRRDRRGRRPRRPPDGHDDPVAIVRWPAYEAAGGRRSASVALLDANRSGIVLSAIGAATTPGCT
jgi:hypothetical protein